LRRRKKREREARERERQKKSLFRRMETRRRGNKEITSFETKTSTGPAWAKNPF
jgi:hypothetical protein